MNTLGQAQSADKALKNMGLNKDQRDWIRLRLSEAAAAWEHTAIETLGDATKRRTSLADKLDVMARRIERDPDAKWLSVGERPGEIWIGVYEGRQSVADLLRTTGIHLRNPGSSITDMRRRPLGTANQQTYLLQCAFNIIAGQVIRLAWAHKETSGTVPASLFRYGPPYRIAEHLVSALLDKDIPADTLLKIARNKNSFLAVEDWRTAKNIS